MSSYAADAASALADVTDAGASVTFSHTTAGTYDAATDTTTGSTVTTVTGSAIRTKGNPLKYEALNLVASEAPTLFFTPSTYGSLPSLNDTVSWGGVVYSVKDIDPVAPDGTAIAARIIVAR